VKSKDKKIPIPRINQKVKVVKSKIDGIGMFATETIDIDEVILIWGGNCYTDNAGAVEAIAKGKGIMQWDEDLYSFETDNIEECFAINHSCDPNAWMNDAFTIVARRKIKKGEEILADYALWEHDEGVVYSWLCNCGTSLCRRKVTGKDWRNTELQKRYKGHFSPLLNKRIQLIERTMKQKKCFHFLNEPEIL
jgi:hypothetical protein